MIGGFLALCMVFSMLPMYAFASETEPTVEAIAVETLPEESVAETTTPIEAPMVPSEVESELTEESEAIALTEAATETTEETTAPTEEYSLPTDVATEPTEETWYQDDVPATEEPEIEDTVSVEESAFGSVPAAMEQEPWAIYSNAAFVTYTQDGTEIDWNTLHAYGADGTESTKVNVQDIDGANTLVLPATVSPDAVTLYLDIPEATTVYIEGAAGSTQMVNGGVVNLNHLCSKGNYDLKFSAKFGTGESSYNVKVMFSANVGTMYLVSEDPVNKGRVWVESSADKSNKAKGSMILQNADGSIVYDGALTQIKGRGNSTWAAEKKPYQIKLDSKTDLLQTGRSGNKSKTWVLLANYYDPAMMRNTIALNLGNALGMESNVECKYVDLYYDGEYRGCYLLAEKVEVGGGRVDITDMEDINEEANPGVDLEDLPTATDVTSNGATYTYCVGMASPEDVTGGYLLEMDFQVRAVEEICYFRTTRNQYIVVKSPECASKEEMAYIATLYQEYEDAVYNNGVNPDTGKAYTDYVDLESLVHYYLINELAKNMDGFQSSTFLYKEAGDDVMTMGPLWDFDLTFGISNAGYGFTETPEGLHTLSGANYDTTLFKFADFRAMVKTEYENNLYPLLTNVVVLGDKNAVSENGALHSISYYYDHIANSATCDNALWHSGRSFNEDTELLRRFISRRAENLREIFSAWSDKNTDQFYDVASSQWYYDAVLWAAENGITTGTSEHTFEPEAVCTRGQIVTFLWRAAGSPEPASSAMSFDDVEESDFYYKAVLWAVENGITNGYGGADTFAPNVTCTRGQVVTMLNRYLGGKATNTGNPFDDVVEGAFYYDAVLWAAENGITTGTSEHTFEPEAVCTRGQIVTFLYRALYQHR